MRNHFLILKTYTGVNTLEEALADKQSLNLLWLEILFNDSISWEKKLKIPRVRLAYVKASIWYHHFRSLINHIKQRKPLKENRGNWDPREYRRFIEVSNYVESQIRTHSKTAH